MDVINNTNNTNNVNNVNNVNNNTWTRDKEKDLIQDVAMGMSFSSLSNKYGKSAESIELRLKRIIYDNVMSGKRIEQIAQLLKMSDDKVRTYFYSYKDFREKHKGVSEVENITNHAITAVNEMINIPQPLAQPLAQLNMQTGGHSKQNDKDREDDVVVRKINRKMKQLEAENQVIKTIIENKDLHKQLNKMIKDGVVDHDVKSLIKEYGRRGKKK
jgi:AraC-like DNA-binding protein